MVFSGNLLRRLYETPPKAVVRALRRRLLGRRDAASVVLETLVKRPQAPYDFLSRYEVILARAIGWTPLAFEGRVVLELGCGPHLGFGPLAVFRGARYIGVDPYLDAAALDSVPLRERYFRPLYKDLTAVYGERGHFDALMTEFRDRATFVRGPLANAAIDEHVDIVLTNSTLEHVDGLEDALARLRRITSDKTRFLHLVDFGNHRRTANPFDGIYDRTPEAYFRKRGRHINLVRPRALLAMVRAAGFDAQLVPYYYTDENYAGGIHAHWQAQMATEDLFLKTALIAGPAGENRAPAEPRSD